MSHKLSFCIAVFISLLGNIDNLKAQQGGPRVDVSGPVVIGQVATVGVVNGESNASALLALDGTRSASPVTIQGYYGDYLLGLNPILLPLSLTNNGSQYISGLVGNSVTPGTQLYFQAAINGSTPQTRLLTGVTTVGVHSGTDPLTLPIVASTTLSLGDDDFVPVNIPFNFTFYGISYNTLFVNANGNLTFEQGSSLTGESLSNFAFNQPRIALVWDNLFPPLGGTITAEIHQDPTNQAHLCIRYRDQPEWYASPYRASFAGCLSQDGKINIYHLTNTNPNAPYILDFATGISPGHIAPANFNWNNYSVPNFGSRIPADRTIQQLFGEQFNPTNSSTSGMGSYQGLMAEIQARGQSRIEFIPTSNNNGYRGFAN